MPVERNLPICPEDHKEGKYYRHVGAYTYRKPIYKCTNGHIFYASGLSVDTGQLSQENWDTTTDSYGQPPWGEYPQRLARKSRTLSSGGSRQ